MNFSKPGYLVRHSIVTVLAVVGLLISMVAWSEEAPPELFDYIPTLKKWGDDPTLIAAVKSQNAMNMTLDAIKARDQQWLNFSGVDDGMQALMNNAAAQRLREFEQQEPFFVELFLMDNQGANVAMTNKTSDYWQGDEDKFIESYKGGKGDVHVGDVEFDESAQAYLVQVSVPIMDGGRAIGALTIGINLDEFLQ